MTALVLSIVLSTYLVICFKFFDRYGINNLSAIVFNYITCVVTGLLLLDSWPDISLLAGKPWLPYAIFLGCCFFSIFNLMGYVASNISVTLTSVASKLSMVVPVMAAVVLYDEKLNALKILALFMALAAVYLTSKKNGAAEAPVHSKGFLLALLIFIGSGINDSIVNHATSGGMPETEFHWFNILIFLSASVLGLLVVLVRYFSKGISIRWKEVAGGVMLGVPNYFSLLFLIVALRKSGLESSLVFPVNNLGIVVLTATCGWLLFSERFSAANRLGILLALASVSVLFFSQDP